MRDLHKTSKNYEKGRRLMEIKEYYSITLYNEKRRAIYHSEDEYDNFDEAQREGFVLLRNHPKADLYSIERFFAVEDV